MKKVYVFKTSSSIYRVDPPIVVLVAGEILRVVNTTALKIKVVVPKAAVKPPATQNISPLGHAEFRAKSQGHGHSKAYSYKVSTSTGKQARANSDPILIIEN